MAADPHGNCFGGTSDHELCSADKPTGPEAPLSIRKFDTHSSENAIAIANHVRL